MEDIVKHKITKTTPLVAKALGKSQSIDHVPAIKYGRAYALKKFESFTCK
jgi:hypothetical protein